MEIARSESELAALALALGARQVRGWSGVEEQLVHRAPEIRPEVIEDAARRIREGGDPLGDTFCSLRSPAERRVLGATYTPEPIIRSMLAWAANEVSPARVVDPGAGSARFLRAAGERFPGAELYGVELDPLASMAARANLAVLGLSDRATISVADFREVALPPVDGRTLFLGNPPYVRHHRIGTRWKSWLIDHARAHGLDASRLSGLHVYFFLTIADQARKGDLGVLVTAAEWLDVNYGSLVRELLLGALGVRAIHVVNPAAAVFPDAATSAAIICFELGARPGFISLRRVESVRELGALQAPRLVRRGRLEATDRWTPLTRARGKVPSGYVELGELCRVHRGAVTGSNKVWIAGPHGHGLPESVFYASVTKARELFAAGPVLTSADTLRRVIDLPVDLGLLSAEDRKAVERFLKIAKRMGAADGFIATHRRVWWAVGLREPAPILATYMARRPPAFVRNVINARHINIAHGLYPRAWLSDGALDALAAHLARCTTTNEGRTYAGGLTKFEPREMERLLVPGPERLIRIAQKTLDRVHPSVTSGLLP